MFVMDMPVDVPVQNPPAVVVMATQPKKGATKTDHTIGVCHLIDARPELRLGAVNAMSPFRAAWIYLKRQGLLPPEQQTAETFNAAKTTLLQKPKHGELEGNDRGTFGYFLKNPDYRGPDRATFLVELAGRRIKVEYFFKVLPKVPGGTDGYNPHEDKKYCPQGSRVWKISLSTSAQRLDLPAHTRPKLPHTLNHSKKIERHFNYVVFDGIFISVSIISLNDNLLNERLHEINSTLYLYTMSYIDKLISYFNKK